MKNILIVALTVVALTSCTKEMTTLPAETQSGTNTFGAMINGAVWGPAKLPIAQSAPILEARFADDNSIFINARNFASSPNESEMEIYLKNIQKPGVVNLNVDTQFYPYQSGSYAYFLKRKITPLNDWITNARYSGTVTVTKIDRAEKIIAGYFQFVAANFAGGDPLTVTEGRFDVKIQ